MTRLFRSAWVIARRDYVATVASKTFLLFLLGPLLPLVFGAMFGLLVASQERPRASSVQLIMPAAEADALLAARAALVRRLGERGLPELSRTGAAGDQPVLTGTLDAPMLAGPGDALERLTGRIGLIVDRARADRATGGHLPPPVTIATRADTGSSPRDDARIDLARGAQFALVFLTMLLAGMTISNLVEEKSNKIIELLAAAVPIDAIFLGKLTGMLGVSLTAITIWASAASLGIGFLPPDLAVPEPMVGWPLYLGLGILYFTALYLLIGALYLGIGAQAGSVREVQTLSMPLTMAQLMIFGLASATVSDPATPLALAAALIPWTSPFAMMARAALLPSLWPHLLALAWQFAAIALTIRIAARQFRRNVLKSGRNTSRKP